MPYLFRADLLMEPFDIHVRNYHTVITLKIGYFDEVKEHPQANTMSSFVGTCADMAPEVLREQSFSKASDMWMFVRFNTTYFNLTLTQTRSLYFLLKRFKHFQTNSLVPLVVLLPSQLLRARAG